MARFCTYLLFLFYFSANPSFSQDDKFSIDIGTAIQSKKTLNTYNSSKFPNQDSIYVGLKYNLNGFSSKLALNYNTKNYITFDNSYINFKKGIASFGIGSLNRKWSFSRKTSLILSSNGRPIQSFYFKLNNKFKSKILPPEAHWSFEILNGITKKSLDNKDSIISGLRATISPTKNLAFEFFQTSQWGDNKRNFNTFKSALINDTNEGKYAHINKMAGIGASYQISNNILPLRFYAQIVGEDEAGSLPSCTAYLTGLEWKNQKIKYPTLATIEYINTRTDISSNGNCGPNSLYNNSTYSYANYGTAMGAHIDTEGTSLELSGQTKIHENFDIIYSMMLTTINASNWSGHRLSSNLQSGLINTLGVSFSKDRFTLSGNVSSQNFILDKANITNGYSIGFKSNISF
jgi:hypothetical protein